MAIVLKKKSAEEAKVERPSNPTTQEVPVKDMKKCKLCQEDAPAKSFKKYEGVEMCAECYAIEKENLEVEEEEHREAMKHAPAEQKAVDKKLKEKPKKGKITVKREEVKVKSVGKSIGKVYTKIVDWQGGYGEPQKMFLIATDPRFFEPGSKIKPLALGAFKASVLAKMMAGEVEGPTIFEYVEAHAKKYAGK